MTFARSAPESRLLRTRDAAAYLGLSPWKLRKLIFDGELSVIQHDQGSPFLLDKNELDRWIERNKRVIAG